MEIKLSYISQNIAHNKEFVISQNIRQIGIDFYCLNILKFLLKFSCFTIVLVAIVQQRELAIQIHVFPLFCSFIYLLVALGLCCSVWVSHCDGFSCCRAQALGCRGFYS